MPVLTANPLLVICALLGACGGAAVAPAPPPVADDFAQCTCEQLKASPVVPTGAELERWHRVRQAGVELVGEVAGVLRAQGCDREDVGAKLTAVLDARDASYRELHALRIATCAGFDRWAAGDASPDHQANDDLLVNVLSTLRSGCNGVPAPTTDRIYAWILTRSCS